MQAIARANRVNEGKNNGLIVDYCGTLRHLRKALATFAGARPGGDGDGGDGGGFGPARPNEELLADLAEAIALVRAFLDGGGACSYARPAMHWLGPAGPFIHLRRMTKALFTLRRKVQSETPVAQIVDSRLRGNDRQRHRSLTCPVLRPTRAAHTDGFPPRAARDSSARMAAPR